MAPSDDDWNERKFSIQPIWLELWNIVRVGNADWEVPEKEADKQILSSFPKATNI